RLMSPHQTRDVIVARGANALKYGASTLGGAINFISPTARNSAPNQLFINGGSFGTHGAGIRTGGVSGDLDGMVTIQHQQRQGYRAHSEGDRISLHANGGWRVSDTLKLRLYTTYIDSEQELPGALTRAQYEDDPD